jgi:anti-sigma factor (TIGR02949 family)
MKVVPIRNTECGRFRKHLGSLLTDDLPKDRRQKVLRHALRCTECLSELQLLAEVSERIRHAVKSQAVPPGLERRIREWIRAEIRRK